MKPRAKHIAYAFCSVCAVLALATALCVRPVTQSFDHVIAQTQDTRIMDRTGQPLGLSYGKAWNEHDIVHLYEMPELLVSAFVFSEDRNFYDHGGVDWKARLAALYQNLRQGETVRGASTITEQTIRLINARPRTLWAKWLEGWEAMLLERHATKTQILEFYLNQIPYASGRRGVVQASRYYFNRDPSTLDAKEILALVVLARAPSAYDLYRSPGRIETPLGRLAAALRDKGLIDQKDMEDLTVSILRTEQPSLPVEARHFARYARLTAQGSAIITTLDGTLQTQVQEIIDQRLKKLSAKNVRNAGAVVMDHTNGDILAWVVGGATDGQTPGGEIDSVLSARQPGSTLKPFLYASALEKGWTAATIVHDEPIAEAIGGGLHRFRNYSSRHYGAITLREALGNSLNIPAVLTIHYVGVPHFLATLKNLGIESLDRGADIYDEGLALGNGEVTLLELTRAYAALANKGVFQPVKVSQDTSLPAGSRKIYSPETASIIGNILSDPNARALEFGNDSVLNLPVRTAVKTGTSTAYRDAWAVGYNDRYVVGLWMGNLDRTPMEDVTGSTGPALALRSIFDRLNRTRDTKPLYLSPTLVYKDVCSRPADSSGNCTLRTEIFAPDHIEPPRQNSSAPSVRAPELVRPTSGLMIAYNPRIPKDSQKFRFEVKELHPDQEIEWILDGSSLGRHKTPHYLWPVEKGAHTLSVVIHTADGDASLEIAPVPFTVK
ncbi:MAG: penicillin-binding protein 1C [Micavibrio aeruginosavorus]|uniref:peptidoglycan glycosyltransferase n=1 Tax=Micavibrio aeruginosavorus TaxID=349221 RepID=A0A2W5A1D3_9BACT|nr:MAG: penicillin-binding protein 1C [Micavibrio aeruginosavorus]